MTTPAAHESAAHDALLEYIGDSNTDDGFDRADMLTFAHLVIDKDRAQRGLIEVVAETLEDRDAHDAAALVRDTDPDDDLWKNYFGPMLDGLQTDYTRIAAQMED